MRVFKVNTGGRVLTPLLLSALLMCGLVAAPATSNAIPPTEVFALNKNGALFRVSRSTGNAALIRQLQGSLVGCAQGTYGGLIYFNNYFYTTCNQTSSMPASSAGKIIRFGFSEKSEITHDTLARTVDTPAQIMTQFDRMVPYHGPNAAFRILARARAGSSPRFYVSYDPIAKSMSWVGPADNGDYEYQNVSLGTSPVCNSSLQIAGAFPVSNPFGAEPRLYIGQAPTPGGGSVLAKSVPSSSGGQCMQIECVLSPGNGQAFHPFTNLWTVAFMSDNIRYDAATGEIWAISNIVPNGTWSILVKVRSPNPQSNYCTNSIGGYPYMNPSYNDAPRSIGNGNDSVIGVFATNNGGPVAGVVIAPDYFANPVPPPQPPPGAAPPWTPEEMTLQLQD